MELGLEVALLLAAGGPRALDQRGLEPRRPLTQTGGAALACALVVARHQAGPGQQMAGGGEAAHVGADLGSNDLGGQRANAGNGSQQFNGGAKGGEVVVDLSIDLSNRRTERIDLV